ncbi:MAG TPA: pyridoxal 5'-phosphate synthase glutaminase subunit PdxT [Bryobacteraceae bacterium]|nr:pyridoxal 5'-phosphate synthase glutaminase subunit PdxT [Bryobacteraceae bacterium]
MNTVGILALQGDFEAHCKAVERAGARSLEVRTAAELTPCDALIIPGGESTTMMKLLDEERMTGAIRNFGAVKPIYGSCAGAILLASEVTRPAQASLGLMDISVERNAYGRQIDSRIARVSLPRGEDRGEEGVEGDAEMEVVFIRAPIIRRVGSEARVLATYAGDPVWVEQGRHMVTTFHPELSADRRVHRRLLEKVSSGKGLF